MEVPRAPHRWCVTPKQAMAIQRRQAARGRQVVWSHPAFANQCIYARNDNELVCVSLAGP